MLGWCHNCANRKGILDNSCCAASSPQVSSLEIDFVSSVLLPVLSEWQNSHHPAIKGENQKSQTEFRMLINRTLKSIFLLVEMNQVPHNCYFKKNGDLKLFVKQSRNFMRKKGEEVISSFPNLPEWEIFIYLFDFYTFLLPSGTQGDVQPELKQ